MTNSDPIIREIELDRFKEVTSLQDKVLASVEKAKSIVDLMEAATKDDSIDHSGEIQWAGLVVRDILDDLKSSVDQFANGLKATA